MVGNLLRRGARDKGDRGNGANVKTANVRLTAHVEAAIGRRFPSAVPGDERAGSVEPQNIPPLVYRMVILPIDDISDSFDVSAEPRKSKRIELALSAGRIDPVLYIVLVVLVVYGASH